MLNQIKNVLVTLPEFFQIIYKKLNMKKINFLYFIEGVNFGGQQSFHFNILKNLDKKKINLHIAYVNERKEMFEEFKSISKSINKLGEVEVGFKKNIISLFKLISQSVKLIKLIRKNDIDVVGCNGFYTFSVSSFSLIFKRFVLVRFVGGDLRKQEGRYFNSIIGKYLYNIPHKYFSYPFGNKLLSQRGVNSKKIVKDYPSHKAVDSVLFRPLIDFELKNNLKINEKDVIIGWVGRLTTAMEVNETFDVFEKLILINKKFKLLIVGDGPMKNELIDRAKQNKYFDHVIFTGKVHYSLVPKYISLMDIVPLIDIDPHGGSILREAMSCGKVVITVNGKSNAQSDFIENNIDGILISPENRIRIATDKINEVINNKKLRQSIEKNARQKVLNEFSFMNLTRIVEKELKKV
jgi:glycosyltransferase involved in cell wall biosynthesis